MDYNSVEYSISDKRRAVWDAEIEMLEIVKKICKEEGIKYYAIAGTLLGTIRHGGFIPWDDDLDVALFRKDYDRFIKAAKEKIPEGFFLQIPESEEDYFFGHAKIRKKNTTGIRYIQYPEKYKHHQGVFIDVFPLDNIPDGKITYKVHKFVALKLMQIVYYAKYYYRLNKHATITKIKHKLCTLLLPNNNAIRKVFGIYEKWIKLPPDTTKRVGFSSTFYHKDNVFSWDRSWFEDTEERPFESTSIMIPKAYHKILSKNYGDYMKPVKGTSEHGEVFFDLNHDFSEYISGDLTFTECDLIL